MANSVSKLKFSESSFNFLQSSIVCCTLYPHGYTAGGSARHNLQCRCQHLAALKELTVSDNDKPENLACDEDAEKKERGPEMSVLMPDIISICFTQPATVDLATALCDFMILTNS